MNIDQNTKLTLSYGQLFDQDALNDYQNEEETAVAQPTIPVICLTNGHKVLTRIPIQWIQVEFYGCIERKAKEMHLVLTVVCP